VHPTYVFAVLVLALPIWALGAPVPKSADKPTEYFPTRVGDKWVYSKTEKGRERREIVEEVISVEEKDGIKTIGIGRPDPDNGDKLVLARTVRVSEKGLLLDLGADGPLTSTWFALKLPHKDGQTWDVGELKATLTAHGPEEVKVPAGTFQAIRVERRGQGDTKPKRLWTHWFAPRVGLVKAKSGGFVFALKSFTPGNG
jgi:hypothetical protein